MTSLYVSKQWRGEHTNSCAPGPEVPFTNFSVPAIGLKYVFHISSFTISHFASVSFASALPFFATSSATLFTTFMAGL